MMRRMIAIFSTMLLSAVMFITSMGPASAIPTVPVHTAQLATSVPVLLSSSEIKRAIILSEDDMHLVGPMYGEKSKKKKKQVAGLTPHEKSIRNIVKSLDKATTEYNSSHEKSNAKKKNGWIGDYPLNATRNASKAASKLLGGSGGAWFKLPKLF